jgi:hypothetical protein
LPINNARCAARDAMAATGTSPPHRIADRNIELIRVKRETRTYRHFENLPGRRWHSIGHRPAILVNNSDNCCVGLFKCRGNCDGACVCADWACRAGIAKWTSFSSAEPAEEGRFYSTGVEDVERFSPLQFSSEPRAVMSATSDHEILIAISFSAGSAEAVG